MTPRLLLLALLTLPALLAGCANPAARDNYPSLAIRPAERVSGTAQPAPAPAQGAPPVAAEASQVAQALARAQSAHRAFLAASPAAIQRIAAARGARSPADSWIAAQVALADLQALRSQSVIAQADLDLLDAAERLAAADQAAPESEGLAAARKAVDLMIGEQDRTIARLAAQLGG
jgi:hypothetical protein